MPRRLSNIVIENASIIYPNFAGKEGPMNREGDRNFCVLIDDRLAQQLDEEGWNVKQTKPDRETGEVQRFLPVSIKYRGRDGNLVRPPTIEMISSAGRTPLSEDEVEILDYQDIKCIDLEIRPYEYDFNGKKGIKAYLKEFYITINESMLARRYSRIPLAGTEETLALTANGEADIVDAEAWYEDDEQKAIER